MEQDKKIANPTIPPLLTSVAQCASIVIPEFETHLANKHKNNSIQALKNMNLKKSTQKMGKEKTKNISNKKMKIDFAGLKWRILMVINPKKVLNDTSIMIVLYRK